MKKIYSILILLFSLISVAQSQEMTENNFLLKKSNVINGLTLKNYYFPLKDFDQHESGSKSLSKQDYLSEIVTTGIELKSDSFTVAKDNNLLYTAILSVYPEKTLLLNNIISKEVKIYPFNVVGEVTENRAIELILNGYDKKNAKTEGGYLYFNKKKYKIIKNEDIQKKLLDLIHNIN